MMAKIRTCKRRSRPRRSPPRASFCWIVALLLLITVQVSAKIRVPSPFASGDKKQENRVGAANAGSDPTPPAKETEPSSIQQNVDNGNSDGFPNWFLKMAQQEQESLDQPDDASGKESTGGKIYGINLSSFSLASLTSQEYLSRIEKRLQRLLQYYERTQRIVARSVDFLWKTTNDVVRYKFPVGIVSAWSAVVVARKILKIKDRRQRKKKQANGEEEQEDRRDETPDTYRYVLRHTGRALDLDADDLTSYRHLGGIEQVRSRLLRSAFSQRTTCRLEEGEPEKEELLEALLGALSMEFIPGGSHSEYIRNMIPSFSKAEDYAHKLKLLPAVESDHHHRQYRIYNHTRHEEEETDHAQDENEKKLIAMALQTAEVRILDSKLRSIRDRLIRTTYRLDRTVKYWKSKVESERLSSSLMATTTTGYWKRFAFFSSSPIQRLKLRWSRLFTLAGTSSSTSTSKNPNFVHNSLLEGDRLRLAFAEAAYKAEILRLGKVLMLLAKRPEEMPDSTLTNALVEQQQEQRRKTEAAQQQQHQQTTLDQQQDGDTNETQAKKISLPMHRIRTMALATREKIAKSLERKKKVDAPPAIMENASPLSKLLQPFKAAWAQRVKRWKEYKRRPRQYRFLAIRFNADGRGKFSVQTYDEGSVAIESDIAKRLLQRDYDAYQKPWLEKSNAWALEARGLIVDTIRESVEASINPMGNTNNNNNNNNMKSRSGSATIGSGEAATNQLHELETTWRIRKYADASANEEDEEEEQHDTSTARQSPLIPAILSSKLASAPKSPYSSAPHRQWMFLYQMSRDINRLKRVGEGKSLKFKWKEVHWIHWLMQWNLVGLPSAALKIWAAMWVHEQSKPYVPKVQEVSREAYTATLEILMTRFWTPFKDLVEELTSRKQKLVTGVSLAEEEASLDIMLKDLELGDGTPSTRHEATIAATRQYESYMRSGLMLHALGGRLARLMLIQVQQLKVSMLGSAETIDVLFQANKINMQLLAVIPAVGILFVGAKVFVRFLFSVRAKDLRPIASVHADMTDYLNELESNIILKKKPSGTAGATVDTGKAAPSNVSQGNLEEEQQQQQQQLGEFALTLYNYLLLLDYSSPQPMPSRQCDVIHQSLTTFLGKNGSFGSVNADGQSRLLDNIKGKHQDLAKFL